MPVATKQCGSTARAGSARILVIEQRYLRTARLLLSGRHLMPVSASVRVSRHRSARNIEQILKAGQNCGITTRLTARAARVDRVRHLPRILPRLRFQRRRNDPAQKIRRRKLRRNCHLAGSRSGPRPRSPTRPFCTSISWRCDAKQARVIFAASDHAVGPHEPGWAGHMVQVRLVSAFVLIGSPEPSDAHAPPGSRSRGARCARARGMPRSLGGFEQSADELGEERYARHDRLAAT
jgi:hypothetical protein